MNRNKRKELLKELTKEFGAPDYINYYMEKLKRGIAYYKLCLLRTLGYLHLYTCITMTILLIKTLNISFKWLFLAIPFAFVFVWAWGSWDIKHIYQRELYISGQKSPIMMDIYNRVKKIEKEVEKIKGAGDV